MEEGGVPNGIRTRVAAVKGRCPGPLDDGDAVVWAAHPSGGATVRASAGGGQRAAGAALGAEAPFTTRASFTRPCCTSAPAACSAAARVANPPTNTV